MQNPTEKINLLDYCQKDLTQFLVDLGEKPFRARQLLQWIHQRGVIDFSLMTDLSVAFRNRLPEIATVIVPEIAWEQEAADGTHKWLLRLHDGNCIETVFIPETDRGTLCISSQVGCALACDFCATGKQGFSRNLSIAEIIGQLWLTQQQLKTRYPEREKVITNVVMMGMGEPLLNLEAVIKAMDLMMDDLAYNLSKHRVTLSTSGVIPAMKKLREESKAALAVSLHAPNDELRNILVPINKKYPLHELMSVCRDYFKDEPRREVMFEYVMLDGINDTPAHAKQLIKLIHQYQVSCKVNLIPFNPFTNTSYRRSTPETVQRFQMMLKNADIHTTVRKTRGEEVDAACGQLKGQVEDRTRRTAAGRERFEKRKITRLILDEHQTQ